MSSRPSLSPSSRSRRPTTPVNNETEKRDRLSGGIRLVPYSPPRLSGDLEGDSITGDAHEQPTDHRRRSSSHNVNWKDPFTSSQTQPAPQTKKKTSPAQHGLSATHPSSILTSPTSSVASFGEAKGRGVSGTKPGSDSGAGPSTPNPPGYSKPSYGRRSSTMSGLDPPPDIQQHGAALTSPSKTPRSRRANHIALHPDSKTFSIVLKPTGNNPHSQQRLSAQSAQSAISDSTIRSPPPSTYSTVSIVTSHDGFSSDAADDDRRSSALSSLAERGVSPFTPASLVSTEAPEDQSTSSWSSRMIGGLRRVESSSYPTDKGKGKEIAEQPSSSTLLPYNEAPPSPKFASSILTAKPSWRSQTSQVTESTIDEDTVNVKVLAQSSPADTDSEGSPVNPSSSSSNFQVFGESSPPRANESSPPRGPYDSSPARAYDSSPPRAYDSSPERAYDSTPPRAYESSPPRAYDHSPQVSVTGPASRGNYFVNAGDSSPESSIQQGNYFVHAGGSSPASSIPPRPRGPRPQSFDGSVASRDQYSQESLLVRPLNPLGRDSPNPGYSRQASRESLRRANSFSSISSLATADTASLITGGTPNVVRLATTPSITSLQQPAWPTQPRAVHHNPAPRHIQPAPRMEPQPHVWSSQLSTVMSEDEGSDLASRHLSSSSVLSSSVQDRSIGHSSRHSRQMLSISSSILGEELSSSDSRSHTRSSSGPFMMRGGRDGAQPTIRDHDEDGDGLADLHQLHHKGSRPRLSHMLNHKSSDRSLRSSISSRAGMSTSNLPQWARIYYGSGERKWHQAPSIMSYSDDSRPASSFRTTGSPRDDDFPSTLFSPRRRPRDFDPDASPTSPDIPRRFSGLHKGLKRMTSSLWSPHLEEDRRAQDPSMWQGPPKASEKGIFGARNRQVFLFAFGFIFPFAWMIASFLPLPPRSTLDIVERGYSTTQFKIPETPEPLAKQTRATDKKRYLSARWWRNMNRIMSVFGLLVIGAIIALAVIGYWQNMSQS